MNHPDAPPLARSAAPFRDLADILGLERNKPYEQAIPARTTYGLIAAAAARFAARPAFIYLPDGSPDTPAQRVSYGELLAQIHRAANLFRALGAGPADAVAILAPNIPLTQVALWGAQLAARACPINYLLAPGHIAALLKASNARLIVALGPNEELDIWSRLKEVLALHPLPVLCIAADAGAGGVAGTTDETAVALEGVDVQVFQAALATQPERLSFDPQLHSDRVAACFHTGGTTGAPKLAQHTHGNEAHVGWFAHRYYGFDENTVMINGFPLFHVAGAFVYGLALLAVGAAQVLPTLSGMRNAVFARNYWKFCERERVSALACVPTILASLVNLPPDADISSVKVAYTGGSPLPTELAAQFERKLGVAVRNILGMTECAGLVSIEPAMAPRVPGSTGLRLPYTEVVAVPWRGGVVQLAERCAAGETGVIVLRGPHISPGYSDPARNAGMFEGGWLVSGDLGHVDATGRIHITGRAKDVIIRGSHNIDPGLVEEAFLAHPAVALCAVVGEPDAYAGELPVAFVTLAPGAAIDAQALLLEVAPQVYERPATPKRLTLLDAMPVTAIGKIYKPALRQLAAQARLQELLGEVALVQGRVALNVTVLEREGRLAARVDVGTSFDADLLQRLHDALGAIALPLELRWA
jgi:fatty-acyl-CoA synthase